MKCQKKSSFYRVFATSFATRIITVNRRYFASKILTGSIFSVILLMDDLLERGSFSTDFLPAQKCANKSYTHFLFTKVH